MNIFRIYPLLPHIPDPIRPHCPCRERIPAERMILYMKKILRFLAAITAALSIAAAMPAAASAAGPCQPVISCTAEEQQMMMWIVQQEVRGASLQHKRVIARVIVNRVLSDKFPDTVSEVLTQKNQFTSLQNWYQRRYEPDADTRRAVWEVVTGRYSDDCGGALFFYAPRWASGSAASWFEKKLHYLFEMEGHRFFS